MTIRKGDNIMVISGAYKGKTGKVSAAFPRGGRVLMEGVNLKKKHQRPRKGGQKGQIVEKAMPIHISNVSLVEGGKAVRAGRKQVGEKWIRVSRKSGKEI